jgi:transcriptional regulator with XRE-family HTH domain
MGAASPMTPEQLRAAREQLGLTQAEFAEAFSVSPRAVGGWEQGMRNGREHAIPAPVALLVEMALRHPTVRRELGIHS